MVQIGHFKKFLKMVLRPSCLVFEVALDGRNILLIGVVRFLVFIVAAGNDRNPPGASLLPLVTALSTFPCALYDGFGRCDQK
jgi:hypothetical protein